MRGYVLRSNRSCGGERCCWVVGGRGGDRWIFGRSTIFLGMFSMISCVGDGLEAYGVWLMVPCLG